MKHTLQTDVKNLITIVIAYNKMPRTTHRKTKSVSNIFCHLHIISYALNTFSAGMFTQKSSARASFTHPIPTCKASVYFWLSRLAVLTGTKLIHVEIYPPFPKLRSRNSSRTLPTKFVRRERWESNPWDLATMFSSQKKNLGAYWYLIDTLCSAQNRKHLKTYPNHNFIVQKSVFWYINTQLDFVWPPGAMISLMDRGQSLRKSLALVLPAARAIHEDKTQLSHGEMVKTLCSVPFF